ncbi:MAG TPA: protein phosphatase 2C domain-containing protein [Ktedonobacteraceae bacterium]|jgi:protein phosphatase
MNITFSKATRAHAEHPERNEDYLVVDRQHGLAVVCDGVGTTTGADQAARVAARTTRRRWQHMFAQFAMSSSPISLLDLEEAARQLLEEANQAVLALGKHLAIESPQPDEKHIFAQTTVALALFYQHLENCLMAYAHIGDSRVYLLRMDAALQRLTVDDGYFLWMINKEEMNEEEAQRIEQAHLADQLSKQEFEHFEKRNGIAQSLGKEHITIHVNSVALYPGDRVLLCTDGIHDNLTDAEIEAILRQGRRTAPAKLFVQGALARSLQDESVCIRAKQDDMSAIVVTLMHANVP